MPKFYVLVEPKDVNARLAILDGKIVAHLPNYLELHEQAPANKDATKQVFAIIPETKDLHVQLDGGRKITYLWKGPKESRALLGDLVTVPILPVGAGAAEPTPAEIAKAAFAAFPEPVRLAGVIAAADPAMLTALPKTTAELPAWAAATLQQFSAPAAAGAAG